MALDLVDDRRELAIGVFFIVRYQNHAQAGTLPEVVEFHLGNRHVELLDAVFDAPEHHSLFFQRPRTRDMQLNGKVADYQ